MTPVVRSDILHLFVVPVLSTKPASDEKLHRSQDKKAKWLGVDPSPDLQADFTTPTTTALETTEPLFVIKDQISLPDLVSLKVNGQPHNGGGYLCGSLARDRLCC